MLLRNLFKLLLRTRAYVVLLGHKQILAAAPFSEKKTAVVGDWGNRPPAVGAARSHLGGNKATARHQWGAGCSRHTCDCILLAAEVLFVWFTFLVGKYKFP